MKTLKMKTLKVLVLGGLLFATTTSATLADSGECHCYDNATPAPSTVNVPLPPPPPPAMDFSETYTPPVVVRAFDKPSSSSAPSKQMNGNLSSEELLVASNATKVQSASTPGDQEITYDLTEVQNPPSVPLSLRTGSTPSDFAPDSPAPNSPASPPAQTPPPKTIVVTGTGKKLIITLKSACVTDPLTGTVKASQADGGNVQIKVSISDGEDPLLGTGPVAGFTFHPQGSGSLTITATAPGFATAIAKVGDGALVNVHKENLFPKEASYEKDLKELCKHKLAAFVGEASVEFALKVASYETGECCIKGVRKRDYTKGSLSGDVKFSCPVPFPPPFGGHLDFSTLKLPGFQLGGNVTFGFMGDVNVVVGGGVTYEKTCKEASNGEPGCTDTTGSLTSGIGFSLGIKGSVTAQILDGTPQTVTGNLQAAKITAGIAGTISHKTCPSNTEATLCFLPINLDVNPSLTLTADGVTFLKIKAFDFKELEKVVIWKGTCGKGGGE